MSDQHINQEIQDVVEGMVEKIRAFTPNEQNRIVAQLLENVVMARDQELIRAQETLKQLVDQFIILNDIIKGTNTKPSVLIADTTLAP